VRSASLITVLTLLSRITGYARDKVIAAVFGAGAASDVFYAAFRIPNLLRQLVAEGALPGAFIPSYAEQRRARTPEEVRLFAARVLSTLTLVVSILTGLGILFAPAIVRVLAKGFAATPGKLDQTILLTRVMFPYLLFVSLAALLQAILNAHGRFAVSALSPVALNLSIIGAAVLLAGRMSDPTLALAVGVLLGGILQMAVQIPAVRTAAGISRWSFAPLDPAVLSVFVLLIPRLFGFGIYAVNLALSTRFASAWDGGVSYLTYGNRVIELVRGGFVISVSTALLPLLAQQALDTDRAPFRETLMFGLRMVAFVTVPGAVGLIVLREPIVRLLFQGGAFGPEATIETAAAMALYAVGLVFISSNSLLTFAHYARKDTRTPVVCAAADLVVFIAASILLRPMGVSSIALATSIAAATHCALLALTLRRREGRLGGRRLAATLLRVLAAAAAMGAATAWVGYRLLGLDRGTTIGRAALGVGVSIAVGVAVYLAAAIVLRSPEPREFVRLLRRRSAPSVAGAGEAS
jgi:putative peptidoglycan lipid II flippase